jgi:ribonuclease BN (tRNA processing enzyme)
MLHSDPCLGYRITADGRTIAFCTDTGYCENAVKLAKEADLLITECAFKPGESNPEWPHLNPETAAKIAVESGAKRLALAHFDAARYLTMDERTEAEKAAREICPASFAASDLMELEI